MKKNYIILLTILFTTVLKVNAQYGLLVNEPAAMFTFNQLWNFNVTYTGTEQGIEHYIEIKVSEENDGPIFSIKTANFKLYSGGLYISLGNVDMLKPLQINLFKPVPYSDLINNGGVFPSGHYSFTYSLYKVVPGGGELKETYPFETIVESLGSIILLNVFDKDTIDTYNPTFNWVYSDLQPNDPRVVFKYKLVELGESQTVEQALYFNNVYYEENLLSVSASLQYPASARKLQNGKTYVWQVSVVNGSNVITQSEIWTFTIRDEKEEEIKPIWYLESVKNSTTSYANVDDNILRIKYLNNFKDKDGALLFKIVDANGKTVLDNKQLPLTVFKGDNRYNIELCNYSKKIKQGLYTFIIEDELGQKWYTNFNNNPKKKCD